MAGQSRRSSSDLKKQLLKEGHAFSFYQVMRLLRYFDGSSVITTEAPSAEADGVRTRPKLSLAFPPADIDRIEELDSDKGPRFLVTATLPGLYGVSSPLPTFYTEDLMDEATADETVTREFIDMLNHRFFSLLYKCWTKYRMFLRVAEERNQTDIHRLFALIGFGEKIMRRGIPEAYGLIRYIGLLTQSSRSAWGLKTLLQDALGGVPAEIVPCILRKVRIPEDQRMFLGVTGASLGVDSFIGGEIEDRMGKFRIRIGPLQQEDFRLLLPGGSRYEKLTFLTKFYVTDPLEYDVELILAEKEAQGVCLGRPEWARLGLDTWIFSEKTLGEVSVRFAPES
jgi:type VI secretion system protein ImpH